MDPHTRPICVITFNKEDPSEIWSGRELMGVLDGLGFGGEMLVFWYDEEAWQVRINVRGLSVLLAADADGTPFRSNGFNSFILRDYQFPGSGDRPAGLKRTDIIQRVKEFAVILRANLRGVEPLES